jgi:hypothetical protein
MNVQNIMYIFRISRIPLYLEYPAYIQNIHNTLYIFRISRISLYIQNIQVILYIEYLEYPVYVQNILCFRVLTLEPNHIQHKRYTL